jgi:hypothetical protein
LEIVSDDDGYKVPGDQTASGLTGRRHHRLMMTTATEIATEIARFPKSEKEPGFGQEKSPPKSAP